MSSREKPLTVLCIYHTRNGTARDVTVASSIIFHQYATWAGYPEREFEGQKMVVDPVVHKTGELDADDLRVRAQRRALREAQRQRMRILQGPMHQASQKCLVMDLPTTDLLKTRVSENFWVRGARRSRGQNKSILAVLHWFWESDHGMLVLVVSWCHEREYESILPVYNPSYYKIYRTRYRYIP